jgi:hypothetical protein
MWRECICLTPDARGKGGSTSPGQKKLFSPIEVDPRGIDTMRAEMGGNRDHHDSDRRDRLPAGKDLQRMKDHGSGPR